MKHGCPRRQQSQNMAKICKSYILTPPHPQGQVMSEKCEEAIDELTVQVWLLYHHPNFKYCTLLVSGAELQTDGQTDNPITRCPRRTFQAGGITTLSKEWEVKFLSKNINKIFAFPLAYYDVISDIIQFNKNPHIDQRAINIIFIYSSVHRYCKIVIIRANLPQRLSEQYIKFC